ncbi:tetratricopeptide repeat protein [Brevibacillus reuszeri]|uniref:tetratricopeptide repeat protein n=1 Tax=Brevibacillus reuszeri TaxID=54915 RepID=UPI002896BFF2|nr:tetratricopeptide repeat protein [Brevibacillus reuszeri]
MPMNQLQQILNKVDAARSIRQSDESSFTAMLEAARQELIQLASEFPADAKVAYECASVHDSLGLETEAVPYYEKAIALDKLDVEDLRGAYLGLGSTYRCIGQVEKSISLLTKGIALYPDDHSLRVFLALAKYNAKDYEGSVQLLLDSLIETSSSEHIQLYRRALGYYRDHLDQTW